MKTHSTLAVVYCLLFAAALQAEDPKPIKALLITGGCCHDYAKQRMILKEGLEARAHVTVEMVHSADTSTKARFDVYEKEDWAKGYDVVIHDECSADVKELPYVANILKAHKEGVAAVNLHCAMHCYRTGNDDWFAFCGIQSAAHGPQKPIEIAFTAKDHPIVKPLKDWTTINEELYNNIHIFDTARALARGQQKIKRKDGTEKTDDCVVAWTNEYGPKKTRVFSTTIGHNNATVADPRYLDLLTRGILWATGHLTQDGSPAPGYGPGGK